MSDAEVGARGEVDITAIVTTHAEGPLVGLTLRSLLDAVGRARLAGLTVEVIAALDNADQPTRDALADAARLGIDLMETTYADQGLVRNEAVGRARGRYIAFLDGDDLWGENWLVEAHPVCERSPGRVIAHPALNWRFGGEYLYAFSPDQEDAFFDEASVRIANPWDTMCLAPYEVYQDHPFSRRDIGAGFANEDWNHNMETVRGGYLHKVVPGTVHFKRRRPFSQHEQARGARSLPPHSRFMDYSWWAEESRDAHGRGLP